MSRLGYSNVSESRLELFALVGPEVMMNIEKSILDYTMLEAHFYGWNSKDPRYTALFKKNFEDGYKVLTEQYKKLLEKKPKGVLKFNKINRNDMWKDIIKRYEQRRKRIGRM